MKAQSLHDGILALRRRTLAIGAAAAALYGLLAALAVLLACMWLDLALDLPPRLRAACGLCALAAGVLLGACVAVVARAMGTVQSLARRVDAVAGGRGQVLTGVDLLLHPTHTGAAARLSVASITAGLAQLAVERAAELAAKVSAAT